MRDYLHLLVAYLVALAAAVAAATALPDGTHPLAVAGAADAVATMVVFAFSLAHDNSSVYDPYWSVAPVALVAYFAWLRVDRGADPVRLTAMSLLVGLWAVRLTFNFLRRWRGLDDEDWRYADYRERYPTAYWLVSFSGFHFFPTLVVYLGCTPLFAVSAQPGRPANWLDLLAAGVTLTAVVVETLADEQLRRFLDSNPPEGKIMSEGLWGYSRHPNYFGELLFWWGLYLFALAADPSWWWTGVGAVSITLLFVFVSLPLIEERSRERRPDWQAHAARVSRLVPWPPDEE